MSHVPLSGTHTLAELAIALGGHLLRPEDGDVPITSVHGLSGAVPGCLSYVDSEKVLPQALDSPCAALIIPPGVACSLPAIVCGSPRMGFARALRLFHPEPAPRAGIHRTARVSSDARVHESACVGPFVVIGDGTLVDEGVHIEAGSHVGRHCRIGSGTRIRPHVVLGDGVQVGARVTLHPRGVVGGSHDGQGVAPSCTLAVEVGDDVEMGARVSIAPGLGQPTRIGSGTKIDNLVHVGSEAQVGRHCILVGHASVEPRACLGDYGVLAGQCVLTSGVTVGPQGVVGSRSVVRADTPAKSMVSGDPARPHRDELRRELALQRLPALARRLEALEQTP